MLRVGTILNGRYEIISAIGSGGMSYVYKAKDMSLKRLVAVKVLKEEYSRDANVVAKFAREAEAAGGLSHPNVVSVYDVGEQFGTYYIVMELVEGFTLKKYIEKKGQLSQHDAVQVTMQVARGLNAAHEQGIIHRDVKPQNIMVSRDGKIKVTDFGIARINDSQTSGANTMGSVHYISPEQARGGVCDERSDIYSLGITLYEMVTGRVPFDGESTVEVALKHVKEPITPPSTYEPDINPNLEKIILKCTQKKPDYRYRTMGALLDDLKRLMATPYEDFVIMPAMSEVGATKVMYKEDADKIRLLSADSKNGSTDAAAARELKVVQEKSKKKAEQAKLRTEPIREKKKTSHLSEEDLAAEDKARKVEKTLNYIMIGIGMLILILVIAIVFRACGLLKRPDTTTAAVKTSSAPASTAASKTSEAETSQPVSTTASEVTVPNVVGQDYMAAQEILQGLQLTVRFEAQTTGEYPEYTVFKQSYPEGTVLKKETEITLWVAIPSDTAVLIPNSISGKSVAEATLILTQEGLKVSDQVTYSYSSITKGLVCDSTPSMGKVVDKGTMLTLVISLGPEKGTIPSVLGMNEADARSALANAGFSPDRVFTDSATMYSENYAAGTVARIYTFDGDLSEGSSLSFSTDIYITLSRGATFSVDPDAFIGRTDIDAAVHDLQTLGLSVMTIPEPLSGYPNGQICWLTLEPDANGVTASHVFTKGDTVYLHYSTHEETTEEEQTEEETTEEQEAPTEDDRAPTEPPTEPDQPTAEDDGTEKIKIDPNLYYGRTDLEAVVQELEALGFTVQTKGEPMSSYPNGQICWVTTEENDGDITADTELPAGSTIWIHYSTKEE